MRAEIIATGTELLSGGIVETNSLRISEMLMQSGIETAFKTVVGDDEKDMEDALRIAIKRTDAVIITGGLGPTEDDITRKVIARVFKRRLVLNEDALAAIKEKFTRRGRGYQTVSDRQALIPAGARLLLNPVGIAPGFFFEENGMFIAALPGVPKELEAIAAEGLSQAISERFGGRMFIRRRTLRTCGVSEPKVNEAVGALLKKSNPVIGLTAKETGVDVIITARESSPERAQSLIDRAESSIREKLGDAIYGIEGQNMEEIVGALLKQRRLTLSVAESCTGGMIAGRITNVSGSSEYFERGVVVYSNGSKTGLLGVPNEMMEQSGAVSREVAEAMARGVRQSAKTDLGLAVTGIAGPGGGSVEKPVGLVFIALASSSGVKVDEHSFFGDREQVRIRASQASLDMVRRHLIG